MTLNNSTNYDVKCAPSANSAALPLLRAAGQVRRMWTLLIVCLLVAVGLDYFFFTGFYSSDDISYYEFARFWWLTGDYPTKLLLGGLRLPIIIWNRGMISLVGPNPHSVAATYVVFHLALILAGFALARRLFDRATAIVAAYLTATAPPLIHYSTTIMPDTFIAVCTVFSLYAFLRAYDRAGGRGDKPSALWMLVCGLSVGLAYMAKESGLILLPFYFFIWLAHSRGRTWKTAVWIGAMFPIGVAVAFLTEYGIFYHLLGRSFYRLGWMNGEIDPATKAHVLRYGLNPIGRFNWVRERINEYYYFVPQAMRWGVLAILAAYPFMRKARWSILLIAAWQFAFLTWGTMSFSEYFPPSIQARYYIPVLPFAVIMFSFVVARLFSLIGRIKSPRLAAPLALVVTGMIVLLPVRGLRVADKAAGKAYRAKTIGNTTRALTHAAAQNNGPVVLSSYLRHRYKFIYQDLKDDWILNANAIDESKLKKMLGGSPFYYVESASQPFDARTPIDGLLDSLTSDILTLPPRARNSKSEAAGNRKTGTDDAASAPIQAYWSTSPECLGRLRVGDDAAVVLDLGWFTPFESRTAEIRSYLGHGLIPLKKMGLKVDRQSVRLLRVVPVTRFVSRESSSPSESGDVDAANAVGRAVWNGIRQEWTLLSMIADAASSQPAARSEPPRGILSPADDDGVGVMLVDAAREYEWLALANRSDDGAILLDAPGYYEVSLSTSSTESANAELRLEVFSAGDRLTPRLSKRIKLRSGTARFGIWAADWGVRIIPALKLSGIGHFTLQEFTINQMAGPN